MESKRPTDKDLQEKALYDIVQYLPLDKLSIKNYSNIDNIVEKAQIECKLLVQYLFNSSTIFKICATMSL